MNDPDRPAPHPPAGLLGRDKDVEFITSYLNGSAVHGAALLLSGEAGIGKTALLDAVAADAVQEGTRVLRASGVQFEADIGYAGLNQLLVPLFDAFDDLAPVHGDALRVAVGIGSGPAPDRLLTSTAALMLLRSAAARTPLLLVVDDLPWLDRATTAVLGFVARRLVGSRVGFLAASREGSDSFFDAGGVREYQVRPLDSSASAELLAQVHPDVSPAVRRRIAGEARGNPLALVELPTALTGEQRTALAAVPSVLPLSQRLQAVFTSRIAGLPAPSRELLLLAALDGTGDLTALETALPGQGALDHLESAERDRLVRISSDTRQLTFRHPLIRSALVDAATAADRRRAHQALAEALEDQPERRAWHLGEAATGPDETVAGYLEQAARHRLRRGDALGAVAALTRAAGLSPAAGDKSRRLAEAAYIGADAGGALEDASRLLAGARTVDPGGQPSLHAAAASAAVLINKDGDIDTAHRLLVGALEAGDQTYDAADNTVVEALHTLMLLCWFGGSPKLWEPVFRVLERLTPEVPELLRVWALTLADPARTGAEAIPHLDSLLATTSTDPTRVVRIGTGSVFLERLAQSRDSSLRVVQNGRAGAAPVRRHWGALLHLCLDYYQVGRWEDAAVLAAEGLQLCEEHDYSYFAWHFQYVQAVLAGATGDVEANIALTRKIVRWAAPRGAHGAQFFACHARALGAIGGSDFETAYRQASLVNPPGVLAPYVPHAMWGALDMVEAALRTGREAEAAAHAAAMRESAMAALSPRLSLLVDAAEALTTPGDDAAALLGQALDRVDPERWPFDVARVRLFRGEHLRRRRATREAREELDRALTVFEQLGAAPWVARTTAELRASGQAVPLLAGPGKASLTAQEREIATLAATGLTNKQIAERLYLSHRTIGTHLYQIYPKLGISSRAGLRDALTALDLREAGDRDAFPPPTPAPHGPVRPTAR